MRCVVCDALPGRVVRGDGAFHRRGSAFRALLVDPSQATAPEIGFAREPRAAAPVAKRQLREILADVFEPRRPSLDRVVERPTHVQPGGLRRGQQSRRSIGG